MERVFEQPAEKGREFVVWIGNEGPPAQGSLLIADAPLVGTFHAAGKVPLLTLAKPVYGFLLERLAVRLAVSRRKLARPPSASFREATRSFPAVHLRRSGRLPGRVRIRSRLSVAATPNPEC